MIRKLDPYFVAAIWITTRLSDMQERITGPYETKPTGPELPNQRKFEDIAAHRGHRQVLLIFTPSPAKPQFKHTLRDIEDNLEDFKARTVELLLIFDTGRPPRNWNYLPGQQAAKARHKFHVKPGDFAVVLLGLDGRVKRQWDETVEYEVMAAAL